MATATSPAVGSAPGCAPARPAVGSSVLFATTGSLRFCRGLARPNAVRLHPVISGRAVLLVNPHLIREEPVGVYTHGDVEIVGSAILSFEVRTRKVPTVFHFPRPLSVDGRQGQRQSLLLLRIVNRKLAALAARFGVYVSGYRRGEE